MPTKKYAISKSLYGEYLLSVSDYNHVCYINTKRILSGYHIVEITEMNLLVRTNSNCFFQTTIIQFYPCVGVGCASKSRILEQFRDSCDSFASGLCEIMIALVTSVMNCLTIPVVLFARLPSVVIK